MNPNKNEYTQDDIDPKDRNDPFFNMLRALYGRDFKVLYAGPLRPQTKKVIENARAKRTR